MTKFVALALVLLAAACADGKGGWFISGLFTSVGTVACKYLAHILSNGAVDSHWNPNANNFALSLAVSGTTVFAGGYFDTLRSFSISLSRCRISSFLEGDMYINPLLNQNAL